jgi:broad specificity phosphatase PhoE
MIAEYLELPVTLELCLREINLGAWEEIPSKEIEEKYPKELAARAQNSFYKRAPNGESPREVAERVLMARNEIAYILNTGTNCALISHRVHREK